MSHRGPDGTEIEVLASQGCFGHNRLSIIDRHERAKQPMWSATERYCLSFNGEIYNYQLLRHELIQLGHRFRTASDSEVLIQAWEEWGVASLSRLVGMFAFAVWDKTAQILYLVRDRMGEKPLFYAPIDQDFSHGLVFASELKGLIQYPFVSKQLSMTALSHYLSYNYTSTQDCIFQNIYKLSPASYLQYDLKSKQCITKAYWSLAEHFHNKLEISFSEAQEQLACLLGDAVKSELIADVPLGAFLSGGIDSASIVHQMCIINASKVNTYSIGFAEKTYNELYYSNMTAKHLGANHQTQTMKPDVTDLLWHINKVLDEPFADPSLLPTSLLCAFAKNFVTVSLSGDGGDELFGGYITYQADRYYQLIQYFPIPLRKFLIKLSQYLPTSFNKVSLDYKIKHFLQGSLCDYNTAHLNWREIFNARQKQLLFRSDYFPLLTSDVNQASRLWFNDVADCHYLEQSMYVDMKTWLVDDILVKVDRASMAHSLEVRAPFLDHRIVEFAARLPLRYKIRNKQGKYIIKHFHAKRLPAKILRQPKKGFNSPISYWLSHELFDMAHAITTSHYLIRWFNKEVIDQMWFEHRKGICDNGHRLFNLMCLGLWCERYL